MARNFHTFDPVAVAGRLSENLNAGLIGKKTP
jgi:hypothetical protein